MDVGGQAHVPAALSPGTDTSGSICVGPRARLDVVVIEKNPWRSARSQLLYLKQEMDHKIYLYLYLYTTSEKTRRRWRVP
jgi:hypothetical protein